MSKSKQDPSILHETIISGIEEVKGEEIISMDLRKIKGAVCDYFIICHGNSTTQVESIADKVKKFTIDHLGESPWRSEGYGNAQWVLLDYVDIVVHVFHRDTREYYKLEDLWGDAEIQHWSSEKNDGRKSVSN